MGVSSYWRSGEASSEEIDDLLDFCRHYKGGGMERRFEVNRRRARSLRYRRTPFRKHGNFDFNDNLKKYLRDVTKGEIVDDPPPPDAIT